MDNTVDIDQVIEVFLQPGEFYWGDRDTRIHTLLGSCVAISVWHPARLVGGMCHIMLPERRSRLPGERATGKYADEAIELFLEQIKRVDPDPGNYQVKIFGGGNMNPALAGPRSVAGRNIQAVHKLLAANHFKLAVERTGGSLYRKLKFEIWNGTVWALEQTVSEVPAHYRDDSVSLGERGN